MIRALPMLLLGCMPSVTPRDKSNPQLHLDTADTGGEAYTQNLAVVSTLADDYSVGALATLHMDTLALSDTLTPIAGDAVVRAVDQRVAVLNRLNTDTLRLYSPGAWSAPDLELALPDLSNPQDAAACGDTLWVSLHNADYLPAYSESGVRMSQADLGPWAGSDGSAEAADIEVVDGALYVALQQFAQDEGWAAEGGAIVRVDCESGQVSEVLKTGPSPSMVAGPEAHTLTIRTGIYGELDGEVQVLDLESQEAETVLTEADLGEDITQIAVHGSSLVFIAADADWNYGVHCVDLRTGIVESGMVTASYLSDLAIDDRGRAWVSARTGWSAAAPVAPGLYLLDAATCAPVLSDGAAIQPTLAPFNVSFL